MSEIQQNSDQVKENVIGGTNNVTIKKGKEEIVTNHDLNSLGNEKIKDDSTNER